MIQTLILKNKQNVKNYHNNAQYNQNKQKWNKLQYLSNEYSYIRFWKLRIENLTKIY